MSTSSAAGRPSWVHKSDGRVVPFDPDRISLDLFAATESLGQPDAFLARELTDSILHFLAAEAEGGVSTTRQIVELAVKVLRELGHPRLAGAFSRQSTAEAPAPVAPPPVERQLGPKLEEVAQLLHAEGTPRQLAAALGRRTLMEYSLREVFARDLTAVHQDGLLTLGNLDLPAALAGGMLSLSSGEQLTRRFAQRIQETSTVLGGCLAMDGPDYLLSEALDPHRVVGEFIRELQLGLATSRVACVINLNSESPPLGAAEPQGGPLFAATLRAIPAEQRLAVADRLLTELLAVNAERAVRIDWHLAAGDFLPQRQERLLALAQRWVDGAALSFVFDRPRRPAVLAEGLDRKHSAVLLTVGVNLPRLAEQPTLQVETSRFLQKLGSLARLAVAAAVQKRDFLRRHSGGRPALTQGFQLDRARLVVVPSGLETAVRRLQERGATGKTALDFGVQILTELRAALEREGRARYLETCLDAAPPVAVESWRGPAEQLFEPPAWDVHASPRQQLKACGTLHGGGTVALMLDGAQPLSAADAVNLLRAAWQQTDLTRLHLRQAASVRPPPPALWGE